MSAPAWFRDAVAGLKAVGLLGNVERSTEDLDEQWRRHGGERNERIMRDMLLAHRTRAYRLRPMMTLPGTPQAGVYLEGLGAISGGRFAVSALDEEWRDDALHRVRFRCPRGTVELAPRTSGEVSSTVIDAPHLLGALNALADAGQFAVLDGVAVFLDDAERAALAAVGVAVEPLVRRPDAVAVSGSAATTAVSSPFERMAAEGVRRGEEQVVDASGLVRPAHRPALEAGGAEQLAKLGGRTWAARGGRPPACPRCRGPMALFLCGGWPYWCRGRHDECDACGQPAAMVFQVPSHDGAGSELRFGSCGLLHVLVCDRAGCRRWAGARIQYT